MGKTVNAVCEAVKKGEPGDGPVFVYPVEDIVRIRTTPYRSRALCYEGDIDTKKPE